jgi:hypothetical protein
LTFSPTSFRANEALDVIQSLKNKGPPSLALSFISDQKQMSAFGAQYAQVEWERLQEACALNPKLADVAAREVEPEAIEAA